MLANTSLAPSVSIIVAVAANGVIGIENRLPWRLPEDLKYFRRRTMGHPIIMGRKTWESLPHALPGRQNLVVSHNPDFHAEGASCFSSLPSAIQACPDAAEIFVIGGAQLYREALPLADRLYLTEIGQAFEGDAYFPAIDLKQWREISRETATSEDGLEYAFVVFERVER
ncbi:MAG: hypothetical protein RIR70_1330 [Pseudomonadota bacterium]|jgi:dihydrofolate reductase